MASDPVDLSPREQRVASVALIIWVVGEVAFRVIGNTTDEWWPEFTLLGGFALFTVGFVVYVARTRNRSVGSVVALALPGRLRGRSE